MVSVNLSQIPDQAKPILMACVATWLRGQWTRTDGIRRIVVQEEAWHLLASPGVAELAQANFKLARQYGVQNILVMHHLAPSPASPERWIVDTDQAMLGAADQAAVDSPESVQPHGAEGLR